MGLIYSPTSSDQIIPWPAVQAGTITQPAAMRSQAILRGNTVFIQVDADDATSNSTSFWFPLPYAPSTVGNQSFTVTAKNANAVITSGARAGVSAGSNICQMRISHSATTTSWTASNNKTNYSSFAYIKNPLQTKRVFICGDSVSVNSESAGTSIANGWRLPELLMAGLTGNKPAIFPLGVPGRRVDQLITDFPTQVLPFLRRGDVVVFRAGVNDIRAGASAATTAQRIRDYCALARAAGAFVIDVTLIPGQLTGDPANTSTDALACAALLIADPSYCDAQVNPSTLVMFNDAADRLNTTFYCGDQLHLTAAGGYVELANIILPVLQIPCNTPGLW